MHGGKCYDIKMMKAERRKERTAKKSITSFALQDEKMHFYLFCLHYEITPTSCASLQFSWLSIRRLLCARFTSSINVIELNCMHETNKIELKLIEVDARSYLGLLLML